MSSGYRNLAAWYGAIFPPSAALKDFLTPHAAQCAESKKAWLDVGCGVGALVEWLTRQGVDACGADPDKDFIAEARAACGAAAERFVVGGMDDIARLFPDVEAFGAVSCLGNVAAHAPDAESFRRFLESSARRLADDGVFTLQIVNYDRVLAKGAPDFPVIERETPDGTKLTFKRKYHSPNWRADEPIVFETELIADGESHRNQTRLTPLLKEQIESAATRCFEKVQFYGDFDRTPWTPRAPATLLSARR